VGQLYLLPYLTHRKAFWVGLDIFISSKVSDINIVFLLMVCRFHKKYFISPVGHYMNIVLIMMYSQVSVVIHRKSAVSRYVWFVAELDPDFT
jgi:hypothetical protein